MDALPALTDEQRATAVQAVKEASEAKQVLGDVAALRQAGVRGSRGQIRKLVDDDLKADFRAARGWSVTAAIQALYTVATDISHPSFERANARLLKAFGGPEFRDVSRHELTGRDGGPMQLIAGRFDPDQLTIEELETLKALAEKAKPKELGNGGG